MKFGIFDHMDRAAVPLAQQYEDRLRLIEAFRRELDEGRAQLLGPLARDADRCADQRNALLSFEKNPSSRR